MKIVCNEESYNANSVVDIVKVISDIYHKGDVCLGEIFAEVKIYGCTIEEVIDIAKELRFKIDGIEDSVDYKE